MKLERSQILDAALQLLNEVGVDQLTTRRLAEKLSVQQPALYWHFKSKRALLDAMNVEILNRGHIHHFPMNGEDWRAFLTNNARSFRRALLAYRDGARIHAGTEAPSEHLERFEQQLTFLVNSGVSFALASQTMMAISRYVVGCVLEEQAERIEGPGRGDALDAEAKPYPILSQAIAYMRCSGETEMFDAGLQLILQGAATQVEVRKAMPPLPAQVKKVSKR